MQFMAGDPGARNISGILQYMQTVGPTAMVAAQGGNALKISLINICTYVHVYIRTYDKNLIV